MNWPAFFSRKYLRAAFVTIIVPKRFVSICARNSDRGVSSTDERLPYPALLMTTSSEPNTYTDAIIALARASFSGTVHSENFVLISISLRQISQRLNVRSRRQHFIARSEARFNNCTTQTTRAAGD